MIRLVLVVLVLLTLCWVGRRAERYPRPVRRRRRRRATPPCPYCQARVGLQQIRVDRAEIYAICRACLRTVAPAPSVRRGASPPGL